MKLLSLQYRPYLAALVLLCVSAWFGPFAHAVPEEKNEHNLPRTFDKATVQQLIDKIEVAYNASVLKVSYFAPRRQSTLPKEEGYDLLTAAVKKEKVDSHRWFVLQSVRAFAAVRLSEDKRDEGIEAYDELFDKESAAEKSGAQDVLQRAVYDFVATVQTHYMTRNGLDVEEIKAVLLKALQIHLNALKNNKPVESAPLWLEAFSAIQHDDPDLEEDKRFTGIVEKSLQDNAFPKTYLLIVTAAAVYMPVDPDHAIDLLQKAKPLLPRNDVDQMQSYYDALVSLLLKSNRLKEAVISQQARVDSTGQGYGKLVRLSLLSKDEKTTQSAISALLATNIAEEEITDVAQMLVGDSADQSLVEAKGTASKQYADQGISLLQSYLAAQRKRDVEQELRARLIIARYYVSQKRIDLAKQALVIDHIEPPSVGSKARLFYDGAKRMLAKFEGMPNKLP